MAQNKYEGTKTKDNLMEAFGGESMAYNKYGYYAKVAKKEGFEQIAAIFEETSGNEKEHAKLWFKELGHLNTTEQNLTDAASGEHFEWAEMYPGFAKMAREEGFEDLAKRFEMVADIENAHEQRYLKLLDRVKQGNVFSEEVTVAWKCRNCGHIHTGTQPPATCPACLHPQAYFERHADNY